MAEKNSLNYITSRKNVMIGSKIRSIMIIKPDTDKKSTDKKSSSNIRSQSLKKVVNKTARKCGGCGRNRKNT